MKTENLKNLAHIAHEILNDSAEYKANKDLIYSLFLEQTPSLEIIQLRLTVIDSYYSTQMNKRLYGISELAIALKQIGTDQETKEKLTLFIENKNSPDIDDLFSKKYGIDKQGKESKLAVSLISKYFYFLNQFQFPIYDSLVRINCHKIFGGESLTKLNIQKYFKKIIELNEENKIKDFEKFDNLCWLYGKIAKGSFSLILGKDAYQKLIKNIDFSSHISTKKIEIIKKNQEGNSIIINKTKKVKTKTENELILDQLNKNINLKEFFTKNQPLFIKYVLEKENKINS
jgi:hypothetical protein